MPSHQPKWGSAFAGGLLAVAATGLAGILGAPALAIAIIGIVSLVMLAWLLARSEDASSARLSRLRAAVAELEGAAGAAPGAEPASTADQLAGRIGALERTIRQRLETLAAERRRLADLFRALDEPVVALDEQGRVILLNPAAETLLGVQADRLVGRAVEEAFTSGEVVRLVGIARGGRAVTEQVRVPRPQGARFWEVAASPVGGEAGEPRASVSLPVVVAIRDVTDLSRTLQVKTDFVANASHELRTPIAALRAAVDTLAGLPDDEVRMRERLMGMITGSIARLEDMVRDLLDLSRLESPEAGVRFEPLDPGELLKGLAADLERVCRERRLTLSFELAPELARMRSDRNLLLLILGNLVENATKFAFEGTVVRVVGSVWQDPAAPRPASARSGARFEVIDQGVGIPLDQQQRVFERFYQIDQARGGGTPRRGTGLGLAIVKHAVRRLNGSIRVQSVWQQGTTMTVELPDCVEPA